jgi:predicted GTPase
MGAGGRDFHNFNVCFRDDPECKVVAFTAAQIPFIEYRTYPPSLAGKHYRTGIPVYPESALTELIRDLKADAVVFAYSDVLHAEVMHRASEALAAGADFELLGPERTMLKSRVPVISVCAVRTGCGKSPVTRKLMGILRKLGRRPAAIRHPMAYCDLERQRAQRFRTIEDINERSCTIEEREEYEPLVAAGFDVYAGVDYADVLKMAEAEADVIVWDGGNNDFSFIRPDLEIVVADALRPGHGTLYHPGETNLRRADVVVVNKVDAGSQEGLMEIRRTVKAINPKAKVIPAESPVDIYPASGQPVSSLKGKKVLVVEDGPTVTHGGMPYGAGFVAAMKSGAKVVNPWPYAKGSLVDALVRYPHMKLVLPALGYSPGQLGELEASVNAVPCDAVVFATPVDLTRLINIKRPSFRVTYAIREIGKTTLASVVKEFLKDR